VELIDGEVFEVPPMLPGHAATVGLLCDLLGERLDRSQWIVRSQLPVRLDDTSEPEPDVWVAQGPATRYRNRHPNAHDLALVIEVSDTTLAFDRTTKLRRYAKAAVAEAWIDSRPERVVHRFAEPDATEGAYRVSEVVEAGGQGSARAIGLDLAVDEILPPQYAHHPREGSDVVGFRSGRPRTTGRNCPHQLPNGGSPLTVLGYASKGPTCSPVTLSMPCSRRAAMMRRSEAFRRPTSIARRPTSPWRS
jgi:Uma2 family endonuclease